MILSGGEMLGGFQELVVLEATVGAASATAGLSPINKQNSNGVFIDMSLLPTTKSFPQPVGADTVVLFLLRRNETIRRPSVGLRV